MNALRHLHEAFTLNPEPVIFVVVVALAVYALWLA